MELRYFFLQYTAKKCLVPLQILSPTALDESCGIALGEIFYTEFSIRMDIFANADSRRKRKGCKIAENMKSGKDA